MLLHSSAPEGLKKVWAGEWLWDILQFGHKPCIRTHFRFHPFKNGTENTFFSGSHHQTPSFSLVHALSITDGHAKSSHELTWLCSRLTHSQAGTAEHRGDRQKLCSIFLRKRPCTPGKKVWVVQEKESSAW